MVHPSGEKSAGDVERRAVSEAGEVEILRVQGGLAFAARREAGLGGAD